MKKTTSPDSTNTTQQEGSEALLDKMIDNQTYKMIGNSFDRKNYEKPTLYSKIEFKARDVHKYDRRSEKHTLSYLNMEITFLIKHDEDTAIITVTHPQTPDFTQESDVEYARKEYRKWLKRGAKVTE